jgi:hypothetical protein
MRQLRLETSVWAVIQEQAAHSRSQNRITRAELQALSRNLLKGLVIKRPRVTEQHGILASVDLEMLSMLPSATRFDTWGQGL